MTEKGDLQNHDDRPIGPEAETADGLPQLPDDAPCPAGAVADDATTLAGGRQADPAGRRIGEYTIKRVIGSGGMGTVYLAQQESPRRPVALKVMGSGIASRSALRRFEFEAQALARLRHPNIAQVYEAGTYDDGTGAAPYFAMEYIPNARTLTEHADVRDMIIRDRLALFAKVCDAVHHGHQKGIIHRDLKPGNILVDSSGEPKIIDFGVARATDSDLAVTTLQTDVGQLIGTLQYMSPEQCDADPHDLDTRSDVYALGVVLYELLSGRLPYEIGRVALHEAARVIREEHPTPLSRINRTLRGDVETIALKSLEKDRERRYESAQELGRDIQRYLANKPIEARPPSLGYQLKMFARRNRVVFAAMVSIAVILVGATLVSNIFLIQANTAANELELEVAQRKVAEEKALNQATAAVAAEEKAVTERDRAAWQSYAANMFAARSAIKNNEMANARHFLERAPAQHRHWEWGHHALQSDESLNVLNGHQHWVVAASFSPEGSRIVTSSWDRTARVWDAATGEQLTVLLGHEDVVNVASFSPDGMSIVTGSDDATVRVWDAETGEELAVLRGHLGKVVAASFNSDGTRIVTGSEDKTARVWSTSTGEEMGVLRGHEQWVWAASFSPDGSRVATASWDGTARIWDAITGELLNVLEGHENWVWAAVFSPDGTRVVTASWDGTSRVWDSTTGEQVAVLRGHEDGVTGAAFSPDGKRIVTISEDSTARLWSAETGEESAVLGGHTNWVVDAAFGPDGERIVTVSEDTTVRVWDAATGDGIAVLRGHGDGVKAVSFSPDGATIVTASTDQTARVWDVATEAEVTILQAEGGWVNSASFDAHGARVVTTSSDGLARVWNSVTGEQMGILRGHEGGVFAAEFSPDGDRIVTGSWDRTARIWSTSTGEELMILRGHESPILAVSFNSDGTQVVTRSQDDTVRVWDPATGQEVAAGQGDEDVLMPARVSLDGGRQATPSGGGLPRILSDPGGALIVTASEDMVARVEVVATGEEIATLRGHEGWVVTATFSADGTRIVTSSEDGTARIWHSRSWRERRAELQDYLEAMSQVASRVDDQFAAGIDPATIVRQIANDRSLTDLQHRAARNLILRTCSEMRERALFSENDH